MSRLIKTFVAIAVVVAFGCLTACRQSNAGGANALINVGASAPLTGQFAQYGAWMKDGINLAAKEINDKGSINGHLLKFF